MLHLLFWHRDNKLWSLLEVMPQLLLPKRLLAEMRV
jgi:hypothetical protein